MSFYLNGRRIVYTNEVPYEADILATNDYNMSGVSSLAQTVLGFGINNATTVRGLACTPTSPPGLAVVIGPGVMYSLEDYDSTPYGVFPADTNPNHMLYKQACIWNPVTLPVTAPGTPGNSVIYLIEGIFDTEDVNNVSRPYFNSADPTMPIFNNNYDTRTDVVLLQAKQGVPGVTPTPPSPDAGYTGLYYVTVANGQTTIGGGDIAKVSTVEGQPFITEGLTQKVSSGTIAAGYVSIVNEQAATYVTGIDVGSVNTIVCNPVNVYGSPVLGMRISVLAANNNTNSTTLTLNGGSTKTIQVSTPLGLVNLVGSEIISGCWYDFKYNGTTWELLNPTPSSSISMPIGTILSFGGTSTPLGFLLCDGSAVSRLTYSNLFSEIGTTWGIGDGSTTFNIPNFQRSVAVGSGGSGTTILGNLVGNVGGFETHTLTTTEMPAHAHTVPIGSASGSPNFISGAFGVQTGTQATSMVGGGDAFTIMQPSAVVNMIIKF